MIKEKWEEKKEQGQKLLKEAIKETLKEHKIKKKDFFKANEQYDTQEDVFLSNNDGSFVREGNPFYKIKENLFQSENQTSLSMGYK